jgi:formylglycine-generating enzyme required for sulfatase activity
VSTQKVEVLEKTYKLVVRAVNFQKDKPIQNVNVKVFRLEKEPITVEQWAENIKNGAPFKRLMLSKDTDDNGNITDGFAEGVYEIHVENFGIKVCELWQNAEILFVEPKKHWWQ